VKPNARVRLFCLPHAGGGASVFRSWNELLPPSIEACPVQLPGRENRIGDTPYRQLRPLVEALATALEPYLELRCALFGHSMGATIAFELAHRLKRRGREPVALIVSARRAPHLPAGEPPIHQLPDAEFREALRDLAGTPDSVLENGELMELLLPLLRADFEINDSYEPSANAPLTCPIVVFGGEDDAAVSRSQLEAWRELTSGPFRLSMLPGGHFIVMDSRDTLLTAIAEELTGSP
jgi:surfactin synthase thioesterase subunit